MSNRTELKRIMFQYGIKAEIVAKDLDVSEYTVDAWLKPDTSKSHRPMPDNLLKLLKMLYRSRKIKKAR